MRYLKLILALVVCCLSTAAAQPVHVIITAGQSNTDGRVSNLKLPTYIQALSTDNADFSEGAYPYCRIAQNDASGKFVPFWPRTTRGKRTNLWAYDAVTYYWLGQLLKEKFYVIKWAVGGTSIAPDYTSNRGRYWSADPEWLAQAKATSDGGRSLLLSFTQEIDSCIEKTLSQLKEGYQIDAFLWHQGESDYNKGKEYYDNLSKVVAYVRTHLSEKTGRDYSKLPFIFGTVSRSNKRYNAEVENGMKRLAEEDPDVYLIDMSEGALQGDKLHFTAPAAEYLGKQMYERLARIIGDASCRKQHPWWGKRIGYIGDSITDPRCHGGKIKNYWAFLKDWLNITPYIYGISGRQWNDVPRQAEKLKAEHGEEVDAILVLMGTNDFNQGIPVGEWFTEKKEKVMAACGGVKTLQTRKRRTLAMDENTYKGRINIGINRLKQLFPEKQIILLTPLHRALANFNDKNLQPDESYQNSCGEYIDAYVQAVKEAGNLWSVPVIDFNSLTGLNPMVEEQLSYFYDPSFDRLHPNTKGQERMARTLMFQLMALPPVF